MQSSLLKLSLFLGVIAPLSVFGQWTKALGLELAAEVIHAEPEQLTVIRPTGAYYGGPYNPFAFQVPASRVYGGIKLQLRSKNERFALLGGVRYSMYQSRYEQPDDYNFDSDIFYFRVSQAENSLEYVRLTALKQTTHYFGLPLEFRFIPFNKRAFRPFLRAGLEASFFMATNTKVRFVDTSPGVSANDVGAILGEASPLMGTGFLGVGAMIGPRVSTEISLPGLFLSGTPSKLIDPVAAIGFSVTYFIPVKSNSNE